MTDWIANTITITFGVTSTVLNIALLRQDREPRPRRAEAAPRAAAAPWPPQQPVPSAPPPRTRSSEPSMVRAILFGAVLVAAMYLLFNSPVARAVMMGGLLAVMTAMWAVRRAREAAPPSGAFLDLLAVLIGQSVVLTILAVPLPSALYLPQFAVAVVVAGFVIAYAMRRIDPS